MRFRTTRLPHACRIICMLLGCILLSGQTEAQQGWPLMVRRGLDAEGNLIDKQLSIYGPSCINLPTVNHRCTIEPRLEAYLGSLPAGIGAIAGTLTGLGGECRQREHHLTCEFRRQMRTEAWITGETVPRNAIMLHFDLVMNVRREGGTLHYSVKYTRRDEQIDLSK